MTPTTSRSAWSASSGTAPKPRNAPILLFYLLAVGLYALLFTFWQAEPVPLNVHLLAILLTATALVPLFRWYATGREEVPIFELIVLSYAAQFSMPIYTQPNRIIIFSQPLYLEWGQIAQALLYVEAGVLTLIISYYLARRLPFVRHAPRLDLPLHPERRRAYLLIALLGGGLVNLLQAMNLLDIGILGAIIGLAGRQVNVALILLAYDVYRSRERRLGAHLLLYGTVLASFIIGLTTGLLENALIPMALLLAVRWQATRRFPWLLVTLGVALYLVLNPAKFGYRELVWYGRETYSFSERVGLWRGLVADSTAELLPAETQRGGGDNVQFALARFDLVHKFAYVQEITPAIKPYYYGSTYSYFLYAWIPRLLWPAKPSASEANEQVDVDYRLKAPGQGSTIGIGQLPEAYVNFGLLGIILVMSIQGFVFALLDSSLNGPRSEGGRAIYLSVMVYFLNGIGSSAAILFGALFQQILANAVILRPFATGWQVGDGDRSARKRPRSYHLNKIK